MASQPDVPSTQSGSPQVVKYLPASAGELVLRLVADMSSTNAEALRDVARSQFAIPAEEATKQEREKTKRHVVDSLPVYFVVIALIAMLGRQVYMGSDPSLSFMVVVLLAAVVAKTNPVDLLREILKRWFGSSAP